MKPFFTKIMNAVPPQLVAVVVVCLAVIALLAVGLYHCFQAIVQPLRD